MICTVHQMLRSFHQIKFGWCKSRRMRWAEHVARMGGQKRCRHGFMKRSEEIVHLEDLGLDGRITLISSWRNEDGGRALDLHSSENGDLTGCCESGNENFGFHKMRRISWLDEEASQDGLCTMRLVTGFQGNSLRASQNTCLIIIF